MKSTRIKAPAILNRAAFELAVDTIAKATTRLRLLEAARDAEVQKAQARHAEEIAELQQQIDLAASMAEKFADEHRAELIPGKAKSNETPLARYGFRLGNRTVALLNRKTCSWEAAIKLLKTFGLATCVRVVEEVNKDAILAKCVDGVITSIEDDGKKTVVARLDTIGLKINQAETFFIEPKVEGADQVKVA